MKKNARTYIRQIEELLKLEEYVEDRDFLQHVFENLPSGANEQGKAYFYKGVIFYLKGKNHKAIKNLKKAIKKYPAFDSFPDLHFIIGCAYSSPLGYQEIIKRGIAKVEKETLKALPHFEKVLKIDPNYHKLGEIYGYLGFVYNSQKKKNAAMECFKKALNANIDLEERGYIHEAIGDTFIEENNIDEAKREYLKAIKYLQDHIDIAILYNEIGSMMGEKKLYSEAVKYFKKALTFSNNVSLPRYKREIEYNTRLLLGLSLKEIGEYKEALFHYQKCKELAKTRKEKKDVDICLKALQARMQHKI